MVFVQLRQETGIQTYITSLCKYYVEAFFTPESVTLPIIDEVFCNWQEIVDRLEPYDGPFADLVQDESLRKGKLFYFYPPKDDKSETSGYRPEEHISDVQEAFQKRYVKHLREHMTFRDNLSEKIDRRMKRMAKKLDKKPSQVTYIGVHIRRTDHLGYIKREFDMEPLDADYFNDAMEYFREEYDNCIFVVASDDIKWAKKHLDQENNHIFFSDAKPTFQWKGGILMDDDLSKAAYDLALLSSCNHTIISRGTFTMWIALLTPGEYMTEYGSIVPVHLQG